MPDAQIREIRRMLQSGQKAQARAILRNLLREDKTNTPAWGLLALAAEDDYEEIRALQQILTLTPNDKWASDRLKAKGLTEQDIAAMLNTDTSYSPPPTPSQAITKMDNDIRQLEGDIADLTSELRDLRAYEEAEDARNRRQAGLLPVLVFVGTLMGSLLGLTADLGETINNARELASFTYPQVRVVGSSTILEDQLGMFDAWAEDFEATQQGPGLFASGVRMQKAAVGSVDGIKLVAEGERAQILAMSEPMSADQETQLRDAGVEIQCAAEIGFDLVVFVTDSNNDAQFAAIPTLRGVLVGRIERWDGVDLDASETPITILYRPGSGTTDYILTTVAEYTNPVGGSETPPEGNYIACSSNEECLDRTLGTNGALYWASSSYIRTQPVEYITLLPILNLSDDVSVAINPLSDTFNPRDYPAQLFRPLYLYVVDNGTGSDQSHVHARDFLRFVRGLRGQQILEERGFYTHFDRPINLTVPLPTGFDPPTAGARNICMEAYRP